MEYKVIQDDIKYHMSNYVIADWDMLLMCIEKQIHVVRRHVHCTQLPVVRLDHV
jgi:hypothetical protein